MIELKYVKRVVKKEIYDYSPSKGFVELWDFSKSNINQESREEAVSIVASISYGNEIAKNPKKLWNYLVKRGHTSPFEFIRFPKKEFDGISHFYVDSGIDGSLRNFNFPTYNKWLENNENPINTLQDLINWHKESIATFKIKVPLFVRSQYHRHRTFSYLELSRRYVKPDKVGFEFWYPKGVNPRNKVYGDELAVRDIYDYMEGAIAIYNNLIERGYKSEIARAFLPQSLYTIFWVMKDFKCARNFYIERYSKQAQEQIREVARAELELLYKYQPEFLGQYVKIVGDDNLGLYDKGGFYKKILDIQSYYKELQDKGWNKDAKYVYVEYGDEDYYARFNIELGLFDEKILKEDVK